MRTVSFKEVLDAALELSGIPASEAQVQEVGVILVHVNRRLRKAWSYFAWPELMATEQRFFRAAYDNGATYAADDEVYYAAEDAYYRALGATTGNLPTDETYWEAATDLERYVAYEQTGETALGAVLEVWDRSPRASALAKAVGYGLSSRGVEFDPSVRTGTRVWLEYRSRPVRMNVNVWDDATTYAAGEEVYFLDTAQADLTGRCFTCVTLTSAGESPATASAKWEEIEFPYVLAAAVGIGAHVDWLKTDGQTSKSKYSEGDFTAALDDEIDEIVGQQQQTPRWKVNTREAV